jgi:uncharacterized protein (DUF2384 family)
MNSTLQLAIRVLGSEEKARMWLGKSRCCFEGFSGWELMDSDSGREVVESVLLMLESGYNA